MPRCRIRRAPCSSAKSPGSAVGYEAVLASELEFFLFSNSYADLHAAGYRGMTPVSPYN